jgi:hypothetical protein
MAAPTAGATAGAGAAAGDLERRKFYDCYSLDDAAIELEANPHLQHLSLRPGYSTGLVLSFLVKGRLAPLRPDASPARVLRFAQALERHRSLRYVAVDLSDLLPFSEHADCREGDALWDRLLRGVLSSSAVDTIRLAHCPSGAVERFSSAFPTGRALRRLTITGRRLDPSCVREIAGMVRRDVQLRTLTLLRCALDAEGCKRICDAAAHNRHLRMLTIGMHSGASSRPLENTFAGAVGKGSSLVHLDVRANWTAEGFVALIQGLKTNETVEKLFLGFLGLESDPTRPFPLAALEDLLSTYNFTIRLVFLESLRQGPEFTALQQCQARVDDLLLRNQRARAAGYRLHLGQYRAGPSASVCAEALARVGSYPTLVFRVLRANAGSLAVPLDPSPALPGRAERGQREGRGALGPARSLKRRPDEKPGPPLRGKQQATERQAIAPYGPSFRASSAGR